MKDWKAFGFFSSEGRYSARGIYSLALAESPKATAMSLSLNNLLRQVNSKETFLRFAEALAEDFRDDQEKEAVNPTPWLGVVQGPNGWYNFTIDAFLEQMCCWATGTSTMTDQPMVPEEPS